MPTFRVERNALAQVRQVITVEADSQEAAELLVLDDSSDAYHGNHTWEYQGVNDDSIVTTVEPVN